ncbi:MAG: hypothetical protein JO023_06935 [Chloroflexi bacterium]|nr:hypothetical protein [Chloroflexota bacterium]
MGRRLAVALLVCLGLIAVALALVLAFDMVVPVLVGVLIVGAVALGIVRR